MNQENGTPNKSLANVLSSRKTRINISRKGSIVKERCNQLMEVAWGLGYHAQILDEDLTYLVRMYIGGNRDTLRDYMGYNGRVVHGRNGSHVIGIRREGYLQLFGYAKRLNRQVWILNHKLVPLRYHIIEKLTLSEGAKINNTYDECAKLNVEKISLSHLESAILQGKGNGETVLEVSSHTVTNNNNNTTARERNATRSFELTPKKDDGLVKGATAVLNGTSGRPIKQ